jgi:hybrid polyketide synthase/nonribosomal peptide synthetase ACE1
MGATIMPEPIAIVGSGCRFPGEASSPSKLWELLKEPRDVLKEIDRFSVDGFYHKDGHHHGTSNVRHSYQLSEDTREFDAQFFNIPASEADSIDPQQRFLLEIIYESIENAGLSIESLSGSSTAVYVGVMCNDYAHITYADLESVPKYAATGSALSILSNRVSYFFNWTGPSMTVDTACSSSLVAVHQAVQVLRSGQSKVAVAAGTNLIFTPSKWTRYDHGRENTKFHSELHRREQRQHAFTNGSISYVVCQRRWLRTR